MPSRASLVVAFRWLLVLFFTIAGLNHFRDPAFYEAIIPPSIPWHHALVVISGIAEIAGGVGVALPLTRRLAGVGLIALLVMVFPANVFMALGGAQAGVKVAPVLLWARLPLQGVFIAWVWLVTVRYRGSSRL